MTKSNSRLHFMDAIRAFAIIMMLQGHFVHSLLGDVYRDKNNLVYTIWEYFRGMTAPTFFTITGFIFTYLLLKQKITGLENPRVLKGVKRAIKVVFWGYLLRLSFYALFTGTVNASFFYVDVLQCIGTSLLLLTGIYLVLYRLNQTWFRNTVFGLGFFIFLFQPIYSSFILESLPQTVANYFTNKNGSIFTLLPWFGYVCFGSFMSTFFLKHGDCKRFYFCATIVLFFVGILLVFFSSPILMLWHSFTEVEIFKAVAYNNFLFIRLGNVCILFSLFILARDYLTNKIITKIGGRTLSIYIIHFFVLYGSWFGLGLSRFFYHSLSPIQVFVGALIFIVSICSLVLFYYKIEKKLKLGTYNLLDKTIQKTKIMSEFSGDLLSDIIRKFKNSRYIRR